MTVTWRCCWAPRGTWPRRAIFRHGPLRLSARRGKRGRGRVMVEEGLFERFPVRAVFGLHNWPGLAAGTFAVHEGPVMAAFDLFEVTVRGRGGHGALPWRRDPVVAAAQMVLAFRRSSAGTSIPAFRAVVSVTEIHGGDTWNVIPEREAARYDAVLPAGGAGASRGRARAGLRERGSRAAGLESRPALRAALPADRQSRRGRDVLSASRWRQTWLGEAGTFATEASRRAWPRRTSPSCWRRSPAASGIGSGPVGPCANLHGPATTSTTTSCLWAPPTGCAWSRKR